MPSVQRAPLVAVPLLAAGLGAGAALAAPATTTTTTTTTTTSPSRTGPVAPAPGTTTTRTGTTGTGTGTTTTGTTGTGSTTTTTTPVDPGGPPKLSALKLAKVVTAQQGHARFLVGLRTRTTATVTVQVYAAKGEKLIRTVTSTQPHAPGRVYFLIEATTEQRYQIPAGVYRQRNQATDAEGRQSNMLKGSFRLKLTTPRGRLDAYTVPLYPALARQMGLQPGGQLVAAVAPGGAAVKAGLRRGDVITSLAGKPVDTLGAWQATLRSIPAETPVPLEYRRGTEVRQGTLSLPPDWTPVADYAPAFKVILEREPKVLAYQLAAARQRIDADKPDEAQTMLDAWPASYRKTAIGQMLQAEILLAQDDVKGALGAYNRAVKADPDLAAAQLGRGLALSRQGRTQEAAAAFGTAEEEDPGDAVAAAFKAYALLATDDTAGALESANRAVALDKLYEDGPIARGLALLAASRRLDGVKALKQGLLLLADPTRAQQLITENLEPNDP